MTDRAAAAEIPSGSGGGLFLQDELGLPMSGRRNTALDGIRVLAAFAVLLTHVGGQTGFEFTGTPASWVVNRGDVGVPIFFALSGLLLYRPWAKATLAGKAGPNVGSYLWRRALRILPAYWAVAIVALLTLNRPHIESISNWAQYLLLVQNYNLHPWWDGTGARGLAQMWSLAIEVTFYALLPFLAALLDWLAWRGTTSVAKRARRLLVGIALLGLLSYPFTVLEYHPTVEFWLGETLPRLMTWYAAGMALAVLAEWARAEPAGGPVGRLCRTIAGSAGACWIIALSCFAIACTPLTGPENLLVSTMWQVELKTALYTVIAIGLIAPVALLPARPTWVSRALGNPVMSFLGRISYGIFLWQFLVIYGFFWLVHAHTVYQGVLYPWPIVLGILISCGAVTIAIAAASFYLLERPAQRLYHVLNRAGRQPRISGPTDAGHGDHLPDAAGAL